MPEPPASPVTPTDKLPLQVAMATLTRLNINTARRFLYPFAPALSRGLGVSLTAITSLIALNQFTGLLSPLFGPLGDRWGYRTLMLLAVGSLAVGMLAVGLFPLYGTVVLGVFLGGIAKSLYDPSLQAYIGERVTYRRRGLVIGLIEMSWAGSSLVGIPLVGLLISRLGWQAPFWVLGLLALVSGAALYFFIPTDRPASTAIRRPASFKQAWQVLRRSRPALGALAYGFLIGAANDTVFVVYGAWLENSFGLGVAALGVATTVIGVAELGGETLVATISDRLGLKRAVTTGALLSTVSYLLLPLVGQTLPLALAALFFTFLTFEFTIVSTFPLLTEVLPQARATMMSAFLALTSLGRVAGALTGGLLWLNGGMLLVGFLAMLLSAGALAAFLWGLHRWQP